MLHTKFQDHRSVGSGEEEFFCHTRALWTAWSCDPTLLYKFSFPFSCSVVDNILYTIDYQ